MQEDLYETIHSDSLKTHLDSFSFRILYQKRIVEVTKATRLVHAEPSRASLTWASLAKWLTALGIAPMEIPFCTSELWKSLNGAELTRSEPWICELLVAGCEVGRIEGCGFGDESQQMG